MSRSKELILLAQRIRALSQTGLVYSLSEYDTERYEELSRLSDEITALATGLKPDDVASGYRPAQEYVTPKVDIRAVVFNEKDEILLVREKMDGCWSLPGGWSDVGYSKVVCSTGFTKAFPTVDPCIFCRSFAAGDDSLQQLVHDTGCGGGNCLCVTVVAVVQQNFTVGIGHIIVGIRLVVFALIAEGGISGGHFPCSGSGNGTAGAHGGHRDVGQLHAGRGNIFLVNGRNMKIIFQKIKAAL